MKVCLRCQKTYSDENLNFCLNDGTPLTKISQPKDSLPETVLINQPRLMSPNDNFGTQPAAQSGWNNQNQLPTPQQPKKSKTWIWVLGILGGVFLICGGGLVGFIALVAKMDNGNSNFSTSDNRKILTSPSVAPDGKDNFKAIDLSVFDKKFSEYGNLEYENGELVMSSQRKGTYFVIVPTLNYKTENAVARITVRNIKEEDTNLGFGLVFHSANTPLKQDYAFLIDSENKKYRVVKHISQKETDEIKWTKSLAIKDGSAENTLEIRDKNGNAEFFINGQSVNSLKNEDIYNGGMTGLYAGDAVAIAFSKLQVEN